MCTKLCIQVFSSSQPQKLETEFLCNEEWTQDAEAVLIQRLHDIFSVVRGKGNSIVVNLEINVADPQHAHFQIKKKLHNLSVPCIQQHKLSIREIEILGLIMQGLTNQEIADKLFICYETVKSHRKNILTKTGARNTASLINYYHQTFFEK